MTYLETLIRWRPYPDEEPIKEGTYPVIFTYGEKQVVGSCDFGVSHNWIGYGAVAVTHFALPEDITTREVEG